MAARGLVKREEINTYPREVTYCLTARGEALRSILADLYQWAGTIVAQDAAPNHGE